MTSRSRRLFSREVLSVSFRSPERGRRECRALDAPAAWGEKKIPTSGSPLRVHRKHPAFPAQWFTAYFVLSPVIGLFCHRRLAQDPARSLTAASRRQGPTTA